MLGDWCTALGVEHRVLPIVIPRGLQALNRLDNIVCLATVWAPLGQFETSQESTDAMG